MFQYIYLIMNNIIIIIIINYVSEGEKCTEYFRKMHFGWWEQTKWVLLIILTLIESTGCLKLDRETKKKGKQKCQNTS